MKGTVLVEQQGTVPPESMFWGLVSSPRPAPFWEVSCSVVFPSDAGSMKEPEVFSSISSREALGNAVFLYRL